MKITLSQIAPRLGGGNISRHLELIQAHVGKSDVIVFPELSLHGYLLQDKVYEAAYTLEDIEPLIEASKDIDIIIGMAYKTHNAIYNAALYLSAGTVLHRHDKNHLPNYGMFEEARYFFKGTDVQAFDTLFGSAMMVVCEDLWRASMIDRIAQQKPRLLFVLSNSPARDFLEGELLIASQWDAILKTTALLCGTTIVFVNRVGFEDGLGFWGGSCIVSPHAQKLAMCTLLEEEIKTFDVGASHFDIQRMIIKHE